MRSILVSSVLALSLVGTSNAATLATPTLATAADSLSCVVTNIGTKPAAIESVLLFNQSGAVVSLDGSTCGATLAPKQSCAIGKISSPVDGFCELKASGKVRLAIIAYNDGVPTAALNGTK